MFENIDYKILSLYVRDYACRFSIREITQRLGINYAHAFKRVKALAKENVLLQKKSGQAQEISLNLRKFETVQWLGFVDEQESQKLKNPTLILLAKEAAQIDPLACIGLFGSRVSGKATKDSDWDVFIITQQSKTKEMGKLLAKFPYARNIQLQVFTVEEFQASLLSSEETVVKHIVRNKQIIYNPYPFYNLVCQWEAVKYAPSQTD